MENIQRINLDFGRSTLPITVFAKQYDKESRYIEIVPLNCGQGYTIESGVTARLQLTKADGHTVINDCEIENGVIKAELTEQCLAAFGIATAEIGLYKGTSLLSSQTFYIDVKKSAYDKDAPESSDEYNSLVEAFEAVDGKVSEAAAAVNAAQTALGDANNAVNSANDAAFSASRAAEYANMSTASANDAASAANEKAAEANQAADNANGAAQIASDAATVATQAAISANSATEGAEKVNISAEQTPTGATITVTDREGVATEVHIDTLTAIKTWEDIRNAVRLGHGAALFPVGYEFTTLDSDTDKNIVWAVRGHNHHTAANGKLTRTMTLEAKYVYSQASGAQKAVQFDASEALYFAENGLAAGTYNFTVANQAWFTADNGKTYQFTLAQAVPAGGQVAVVMTYNATLEGKSVKTYASPAATEAIETATLTEGATGTSLGTTNGSGNINHMHRIVFGSNNYAQSAVRQWLNSDAVAGSVWTPTNKFDRAPSWHTSYNGFMHGLPADFLAVVQSAIIPCRTNGVYECNSLDGTEFVINQVYNLKDKFFLLSRPEIYGTWDSSNYKDGELLEYYDGLTNEERKKFDVAGSVRSAWLRSPIPSYASYARLVYTDGNVNSSGACYSHGVAPACIIA